MSQASAAVWAVVDAVADVLANVLAAVWAEMLAGLLGLVGLCWHGRQCACLYRLIGIEALWTHHQPVAQRELLERDGHHLTALWTSCLHNSLLFSSLEILDALGTLEMSQNYCKKVD